MSVGINDFISYFDTGARPNFYDVQIIGGVSQGGFNMQFDPQDGHNFRCISASLPVLNWEPMKKQTFASKSNPRWNSKF